MEPHLEEDRSSKFSPSKLDVYKNCPRRYQYRYVDRISRQRKTPEIALGVAVHAAFEQLYELVSGGKRPTLEDVQSAFEREFDAQWAESVVVKNERFDKEDWRRVGRDCVELYYKAHEPFTEDRTVAVEKRVGFSLLVDGHEYRIEGFIDRLSLAPDGAFEIHDYKTSKSLPGQEKVDEDWQLALYELAVRREWPDAGAVRLKWHYVRHGRTLVSARDEAARDRLLAAAAALVSEIKHDHVFAPKVGPLCDWCEYRDLCPVFAHPEAVAAMPTAERGRDQGVALADAFAAIESRRRALKDELKAVERERAELGERLAAWAEARGVTSVAGEQDLVALSFKEEVHLPTKSGEPERHAQLEAEARRSPLWGDLARLDGHALLEGARTRRWGGELRALAESWIERFGRRDKTWSARVKRRADGADD